MHSALAMHFGFEKNSFRSGIALMKRFISCVADEDDGDDENDGDGDGDDDDDDDEDDSI